MNAKQNDLRSFASGFRQDFASRPVGLATILVLAFAPGLFAQPDPSAGEPAVHLYVVRRALDGVAIPRVRELAHSAVLLESKSGAWYLLEYMPDSVAHLSLVSPSIKQTHEGHVDLIMNGWTDQGPKAFEWTRQKRGVRLDQAQSIADLQNLMQSLMGEYSFWRSEHCHAAQERLRDQLGVLGGEAVWDDDPFVMAAGQLTFEAEGREGGRFHSRTPHVPSQNSGLTVGRGYDLKERTAAEVQQTLKAVGLADDTVAAFAGAIGLSGDAAREYLAKNLDQLGELDVRQQKRLFEITYAQIEADVRRICAKADVVQKYGATDWEGLNTRVRDVLIDLRFRGDYTPTSRGFLQKHVSANDFEAFKAAVVEVKNWPGVPQSRFNARREYISQE